MGTTPSRESKFGFIVRCMPFMGNEEPGIKTTGSAELVSDGLEAFKSLLRGRFDGEKYVEEILPPKFSAALGVV